MRRKLLKPLLLAAALFIGASAWATDVPYNVGSSTSDVWGTAFSDVWTMTGDGVVTVTFTNHCSTDGNWWENWLLLCGNENYTPGALADEDRYFQMRSDRWDDAAGSAVGFILSNDYLTDFKPFQNEATVTLKIVRHGSTVNVNTSVTKDATTRTMTYVKTGLEGTVNFFLTQNLSYMEVTAQDFSTNLAGEIMTNAYMSFTDATITSNTITGEVGSMSWSGQWSATPSIDNNMLRVGNMADGTVALIGEAAGAKDIVTVTFDMGMLGLTNRYAQFKVTDKNGLVLIDEEFQVYNNAGFKENQNTLGFAITDFVSQNVSTNPGMIDNIKNTFTLSFNYATGKISASVTNKNGTVNKQIDMPVAAAAIASFAVRSNFNNADRRNYFDNLKITTEIGNYAAASTTYTVKYKSGGVEIKDESTGRIGDVGATPVLEAGDMETFYSADGSKKYVYASDDASTTTIADGGTTVVTVNFTTYEKRTYTLNAVDNSSTVLGELATGYVYADAPSATVNIPWYVLYGGTLYNKDGNSTTFDVESDGQISTVEYTITDKTNVVFYSEGEDLTGVTKVTNNSASKKGIARIPNETTYANLGAGSYTVYVRAHSGNSSGGTAIFKTGDVEFARKTFAGSTNNQDFNANFALLTSTDVKIQYNSGNSTGLDYIYVVKNSDDVIIPVTVGANGYTTFASPYALDLTNLPEGVTAYKAKLVQEDEKTIVDFETMSQTVPAYTGFLLKGPAKAEVSIPVVEKGVNVTDNVLCAGAKINEDISGNYAFYGMKKATAEDEAIVFGLFDPANVIIPADKAYLKIEKPAAARLTVSFNGETTGISTVEAVKAEAEGIYNLNGQRVAAPQKGLYIVNGKKVIMK